MGNPEKPSRLAPMKSSVSVKALIIGVLILILLIPAALVQGLIHERENRRDRAVNDIASKWGQEQTVAGPVISVPYKIPYEPDKNDRDKTPRWDIGYLHFLPDDLEYTGTLEPEIRYRGIYEAILYTSDITISGTFSHPRLRTVDVPGDRILWEQAFIAVGISDMVGIREQIDLNVGGKVLPMNPGIRTNDVLGSGVSARLPLDGPEREPIPFSLRLSLNGNEQLHFAPLGKETRASLSAPWESPSFSGAFLPKERTVSKDGFDATWRVLHLNRNFPQQWASGDDSGHNAFQISNASFGVKLYRPVDVYDKAGRTAKYAILFITFAFIAFFVSEIMNRRRVHPIQYLLIGFAVVLFYTLLIALSEHICFGWSYLLASVGVIGMITGYAKSILDSKRMAGMVGALLSLLYAFLYVVLQLEDYALLVGSLGLFVVLAGIMYFTRKIDWYRVNLDEEGG